MSGVILQSELENLVLEQMFKAINADLGWLSAQDVADELEGQSSQRVGMALRSLDTRKMVRARHNAVSGSRYELTEQGYLFVEEHHSKRNEALAPASDRIVSFDHNYAEFEEIEQGLRQLSEDIRGANSIPVTIEGRDRISRALDAAVLLWSALELKLVQLKVGVLLAVQDAAEALKSTAKAVAAALLIDAVKAFIKTHTGIDLDKF